MRRKKEICLFSVLLLTIFGIIGCSNVVQTADEITEIYCVAYENAVKKEEIEATKETELTKGIEATGNLESIRSIVNQLGEKGYVAIDSENQVDMTEAEKVIQFCKQVEEKQEAELSILVVRYSNELIKYDLKTEGGNVDIVREYFQYTNGQLQSMNTGSYQADFWTYTEEGYLIFSGSMYSEEQYVLSLSGEEEHVALRVLPLDEECRELNRKYIRPVGYGKNNMFLSNWCEENFGELNFYDLYDIFYPIINQNTVPYVSDENLEIRASYQIPKAEFENVIMTYFTIDSETLRSKVTYFSEYETYEYKPRGFYEVEYPEIPYPEVVSYLENSDGTITLTVNAVYPNENTSKLFVHEVVVRPLPDGCFQYVSNRVIVPADSNEMWWHTERLEMEEAEEDCNQAMELFRDIYEHADKGEATNVVLADETVLAIQGEVKETGNPVTTKVLYSNMENYESMETFLEACMDGESGSIVTFEIRYDGGVRRKKYIFDGTDMYLFSTSAMWNEANQPKVADSYYTQIKEWEYTDKGWFCYELCVPEPPEVTEIVDGSCIVRVNPMTEEQREISQKCVQGLGYQGNNLLYSSWDINHMEELDYNGIYEYFYRMKYEERFNPENCPDGIPKAEFENLIMEYLPVTADQIQEYAVFDEANQTYIWKPLGCYNGTPTFFGTSIPEVTNIMQNEDGTTTLTVDAVCDMVICDDAVITHELTVQFAEDGSFQYLGNEILGDGIKEIPEYQYRVIGDEE